MANRNNYFFTGILIGAAVGAASTLFHKETRKAVSQQTAQLGTQTANFLRTVRDNPDAISTQLEQQTNRLRLTFADVAEDLQDVRDKVNEIRTSSQAAYQSAKDATGEIRGIGTKIRETGEDVSAIQTPVPVNEQSENENAPLH